ncbi:MAG: peptide-methionine (S)-S-oxide reductase MsrA [Vampirovibrionales bacterium]|nr:peptide-methionine (S)-S-oxide reductase MsrA [Vampirovibrionales bacterium]
MREEKNTLEKATFAAGCFWGIEKAFAETPGVIDTRVGYTGGATENPTYQQVCSDTTGHAEAVLVSFDPNRVSYEQLLSLFWQMHDPTQLNRQGPDFGSQYRSAIYYHSDTQREAAVASKQALDASGKLSRPIMTEVTEASKFYEAEEYHQQYWKTHPLYCH